MNTMSNCRRDRRAPALVLVALFLLCAATASAGSARDEYFDTRSLGMGGTATTVSTGFASLVHNPALLARAEMGIDIVNLQVRMGQDVPDMFNFYSDYGEAFDVYNDTSLSVQEALLEGLTPYDDKTIGFGGCPNVGLTKRNFAAGIYGTASAEFRTDKGVFEPRVYLSGRIAQVFSVGASMEIPKDWTMFILPNKLHGGAAVRVAKIWDVRQIRMSATDIELGSTLDTISTDAVTGFGLDIGFLYELSPGRVDVGFTANDVIADIDGDKPPTIFDLGLSFRPTERLVLAADVKDVFFHDGENFFNKLHAGAELKIGPAFAARCGVGEGYPSFGAGIEFKQFALEGAVFGRGLGETPGTRSEWNYAGRIRLGL